MTADPDAAQDGDGLVVPGVGAFAACMAGLRAVGGDAQIARRIELGRPVLGICVGMQVLFEAGVEHGLRARAAASGRARSSGSTRPCCRTWAGTPSTWLRGSRLFAGIPAGERFYFVHSYALRLADAAPLTEAGAKLTVAEHGEPFAAAVEHGVVSATQFHPEKSGDAGAMVLSNWQESLFSPGGRPPGDPPHGGLAQPPIPPAPPGRIGDL